MCTVLLPSVVILPPVHTRRHLRLCDVCDSHWTVQVKKQPWILDFALQRVSTRVSKQLGH